MDHSDLMIGLLPNERVGLLLFKRLNFKLFLLLLPALAFFAVFIVYPVFNALYTSFFRWNGVAKPVWVGFHNWSIELTSPQMYHAIWLTIVVMAVSWVVQTPLSLVIGLFLSRRGKYQTVMSVFYFTPLLFSAAALGISWSYILNPSFGLLQSLVTSIFHTPYTFDALGNTKIVIFTLILIIAWEFIPFHTLLYQSGARAIPQSLYEAADLDGATSWTKLWNITIPQLKNTIVTSTVIILTGSLTYFDIIFVLTGGGPGDATSVIALDMYKKAFQEYQMGVGSTIAVIMTVFGLLLSLILVRTTGFSRMESQMEGA